MVYLEFREIYGRPARMPDLIHTISRYSLRDWLAVLSRIEFYHERDGFDFYSPLVQRGLAEAFFPDQLLQQVKSLELRRDQSQPHSLFFTHSQILNLRRLAILHAPRASQNPLLQPPLPEDAAAAFLQMNELSDSVEPSGERPDQTSISPESIIELIIRQFYLNHVPIKRNLFGRLETLLFDLPPSFAADPDFIDLEKAFARVMGVSLRDYTAVLWALMAPWAGRSSPDSSPWTLAINTSQYLAKGRLAPEVVSKIKALVSAPPEKLRKAIHIQADRFPNHWPYSTLPMREFPFLEPEPGILSLLGLGFAYDKLCSGVYYVLEDRLNEDAKRRFRPFFGKLCQRYVENLCLHYLGDSFQREAKYNSPKGRLNGADGLIEAGTRLYFLEVKSSPLRLVTKTTGSLSEFLADADYRKHGFIRAARQLDRLITDFLDGHFRAFGKSSLKYHSIIPIMVTLEPLPEDPRVNDWMLSQIRSRKLLRQHNVGELQILSFEELEALLPAAQNEGFGEVMWHKMATPTHNREGFHEFLRLRHSDSTNEIINAAADRFMNEASNRAIGAEHLRDRA